MKRINMKSILLLSFVASTVLSSVSCKKSDIFPYESTNKLWFTTVDPTNTNIKINDVIRSFSHYPGKTELEVGFPINLIGQIPQTDMTYSVVPVDSLTTAVASEYEIVSPVFRAGRVVDTLTIKLIKSERMNLQNVKLTLCLVPDENFDQGYTDRIQAKVTFNNITTKPDWWTEEMELSYFGVYSPKKFEQFCIFAGRYEIEGLTPSQLRRLLLNFKKYIADNHITEEDGSPMIIPII